MPVNRTCKYSPCFKDDCVCHNCWQWKTEIKSEEHLFFFFLLNPIVLHKLAVVIIALPSLHIARVAIMQTCLGQVLEQVTSLGQAGKNWPLFFFFFPQHFSFSDSTFNISHIAYQSFGRWKGEEKTTCPEERRYLQHILEIFVEKVSK